LTLFKLKSGLLLKHTKKQSLPLNMVS